jgi:hypothetical protein
MRSGGFAEGRRRSAAGRHRLTHRKPQQRVFVQLLHHQGGHLLVRQHFHTEKHINYLGEWSKFTKSHNFIGVTEFEILVVLVTKAKY